MDNKKSLEISGRLLYPLSIGNAAFISEDDGLRQTSTVLSMEKISQTDVRFETRNTHYLLHLKEGDVRVERN